MTNHRHSARVCSLTLLIVLGFATAQGQYAGGSNPIALSLSNSIAARIGDPWIAGSNPATLAATARPHASFFFSPGLIVPGLDEGGIVVAFPLDSTWRMGASASATQIEGYREVAAAGSIAGTFGPISSGLTCVVHTISIDRYGSTLAPTISLGVLANLSDRIRFGGAAINLLHAQLADADLPQRIALGFAFDLDSATTLSTDASHELHRPIATSIALSLKLGRGVTLRGGATNEPGGVSAGIGYQSGDVSVDYGAVFVMSVGLTHALGVGIEW